MTTELVSIYIISICIIVVAIFIIATTINNNRKRNNSKISFKESMDLVELPVVTFYNGNKKLNFLLDTGSNLTYINKSVLPELSYEKSDKTNSIIGIEGVPRNGELCKMTLSYRNQVFEEDFCINDLDNAFNIVKQESGVQIHGILGSKFFEKYKYVIDFKDLIAYIK